MLLDKQNGQSYMVGFDLRDESCQMSWCCRGKDGAVQEPVTYAVPEQISLPAGVVQGSYGNSAASAGAEGGNSRSGNAAANRASGAAFVPGGYGGAVASDSAGYGGAAAPDAPVYGGAAASDAPVYGGAAAPEGPMGQFDIPTALAKREGVNQWHHGVEAICKAADPSYTYVPHLLSQAREHSVITIEDTAYEPEALLALFISRCLGDLSDLMPDHRLSAIMFTSRRMDGRTINVLENVRQRLNVKCEVYYQSYADSYYDFMLNQEKALREPASALFEYEPGGKLRVSRLMFNLHTQPVVAYEEESEYPGFSSQDDAGRDEEFARIVRDELVGRNYVSSYLIGSGFKGGWMRKSSRLLCGNGRRAFLGANLYSKGAAYGAMFRVLKPAILSEYFFLDESKLRTNVLLEAYSHGTVQEITLVEAGVNWYEVEGRIDLILESTGELNLILKSLTGGPEKPYHIRLEGLPVREGRITRIRVEYAMRQPDVLTLLMTDLGFGETFPSSRLKWEQKVTI